MCFINFALFSGQLRAKTQRIIIVLIIIQKTKEKSFKIFKRFLRKLLKKVQFSHEQRPWRKPDDSEQIHQIYCRLLNFIYSKFLVKDLFLKVWSILAVTYGSRYSRMDQVKFVEERLDDLLRQTISLQIF